MNKTIILPADFFKQIAKAVESALYGTSYFGEDDSVGCRVCCGVASYEDHALNCELHNAHLEIQKQLVQIL